MRRGCEVDGEGVRWGGRRGEVDGVWVRWRECG